MSEAPPVRPAREDEVEQLGQLWSAMYAHQREHGMVLPLRDDAQAIWTRQLSGRLDSPVSVILVAEGQAGTLHGFLAAQTKRLPAHLAAVKPKVGFISEVFVKPEQRGQQIGKLLVDAAFEWFRAADVGSVELHVLVNNQGARQFWERMGFVPELLQMRAQRG